MSLILAILFGAYGGFPGTSGSTYIPYGYPFVTTATHATVQTVHARVVK